MNPSSASKWNTFFDSLTIDFPDVTTSFPEPFDKLNGVINLEDFTNDQIDDLIDFLTDFVTKRATS